MRRLLLGLVCAGLLAACNSNPNSPSREGSVQFRLDANSCGAAFGNSVYTFTFFVDGTTIGSGNLGIGNTSASFFVIAGSHVASANVANTTVRWVNLNFSVTAGQTFTYILTC